MFVLIVFHILRRQFDSSITNSLESTSIIISIPPGKILLVVISRSLCECHMNAKPASSVGEFATVPEGGVVPVEPTARTVAFATKIGTAAEPGAVRQDVRIGQSYRAADRNIAERSILNRLVVVLTPLVIVDRSAALPVL